MFLQILGFTVGLLYLWWEYHADSKVWLASVVMPAISMWIYFTKGLYADFGINIYYLLIAVYGFWNWNRKTHRPSQAPQTASTTGSKTPSNSEYPSSAIASSSVSSEIISTTDANASSASSEASVPTEDNAASGKHELPVTHTPLKVWGMVTVASGVLWWLIWWILVTFTDSTVPVADAFTTALSIVGLWMMARKYAEQWLVWLVVDLVCSCLYWYKGIPFYCILYAIYTVIAWFGYRKWLRLIPNDLH